MKGVFHWTEAPAEILGDFLIVLNKVEENGNNYDVSLEISQHGQACIAFPEWSILRHVVLCCRVGFGLHKIKN